jgi:NTP pyrophosphatase (non-canonical NTP hydrolase)
MNLSEYQQWVPQRVNLEKCWLRRQQLPRTYVSGEEYILSANLSARELALAAFGLAGEVGELIEETDSFTPNTAKIKIEFGDVLWYLSLFAQIHEVELSKTESYFSDDDPFMALVVESAKLIDSHKKIMFHGTEFTPEWKEKIQLSIMKCFQAYLQALHFYNLSLSEIINLNVAKLEKRDGKNLEKWSDFHGEREAR